jgi:cell wall-associated NlpC family hydrolase
MYTSRGPAPRRPGAAALLAAILASPALAAAGRPEGVVLTPVENMYSKADASVDVVSQATLGQVVGILERSSGFARVETPDGYPGWIAAGAIQEYPDAATPRYATRGPVVEVVNLLAQVYREPSVITARPKVQAPLGTRLEATGRAEEGWYAVTLPGGEGGFVQAGDVVPVEGGSPRRRGTPAEVVATARRFLGAPYLWGGMTVQGVDCSGFVSRVYFVNGVELLRDADMQFEDPRGLPVDKQDLQPGDLLFFGKESVTHVGLYQGDGRFIHATTHETPVVQESRLEDAPWPGLFRGARRPR